MESGNSYLSLLWYLSSPGTRDQQFGGNVLYEGLLVMGNCTIMVHEKQWIYVTTTSAEKCEAGGIFEIIEGTRINLLQSRAYKRCLPTNDFIIDIIF